MRWTNRFFRYLWRANAVLIFLAVSALGYATVSALGSRGKVQSHSAFYPDSANAGAADLRLGQPVKVTGTAVLRAEVHVAGEVSVVTPSSGASSWPPRNLLLIDVEGHTARWLLRDGGHLLTDITDVTRKDAELGTRTIATVVVSRPLPGFNAGTLLLLDPAGRTARPVAGNVSQVVHADLDGIGRIAVVYGRGRKELVVATFDANTLERIAENEIALPPLAGLK